MANQKSYKNFNLQNIKDVDELIEYIKLHGNFTEKHFNQLLKAIKNSSQPQRIRMKLIHQVKPLISQDMIKDNNAKTEIGCILSDDEKNDFFTRPHKASEFILKDGFMRIDRYILKSKRIKKVHPSWLIDIDHDFYIVRDYLFKDRFYFEPPTDLSFLLNGIHRLVTKQKHDEEYLDILKDWPNDFYSFLDLPSKVKTTNHSPNSTFITIISSAKKTSPNDFIYVPLNDITVHDGVITINFENAEFITEEIILNDNLEKEFITNISWDKFKEYLFSKYYTDSIEFYEEELRTLYKQQLDKFLKEFRNHKPKVFQTFLTKEHFLEIYGVNNRCYLKCDTNAAPLWAIDKMSSMLRAMSRSVYRKYTINEHTKHELKNARTQFEAMLCSPLDDLLYSGREIISCFDINSTYNLYEVIDPCLLERDLPLYLCNTKKYVIVQFHEWILHCSDYEWDTSESFKSYLVWSRESDCSIIYMYPTNKKYSNYIFYIDISKYSLQFVVFFIYRYFSSGIKNKRQDITNNFFFKQLGIFHVARF